MKKRLIPSSHVMGNLIEYAENCELGITIIATGIHTDLYPGMSTQYSVGFVLNRSDLAKVIVLFAYSHKKIYLICKNDTWDSEATTIS